MSDAEAARARQRIEEQLARIAHGSRAFVSRVRNEAHVIMRDLIDPKGEAVASLVDAERAAGAAALLLPMDLITWETWILGQIGDRDELDLDVNTHQDIWFGLGSWIGDALRERHGGFWLLVGDDPHGWRIGFSKVMLEIAPHAFAEKLLRSGEGLGKRMVGEIERIRSTHDAAKQAEGGKLKDRYQPHHYARLHTVPLAQWMVLDLRRVHSLWNDKPASELRTTVAEAGKKLPPQNAQVLAKMDEQIGKLDADKPVGGQAQDRGLYEAVAQVVGLRRATQPIAADMLEKLVLPALHIGTPQQFPPLGEDDIANVKKGADLFALFVDVVPYAHQAEEGGFLGTFSPKEMSTPYADRLNLELGKGDWVVVNASRLRPLLEKFDGKRLVDRFTAFIDYVRKHPGVPRLPDDAGKGLAEGVARALLELRACVVGVAEGQALVFRLLPPG